MSRFRWFPFDAAEWRDVSDLLSEAERGIYIELLSVYWISQPAEMVKLPAEAWSRRLRLSPGTPFPAALHTFVDQGLIELEDVDGTTLGIRIGWLSDEYRKRAKDSERHGRKVPGTDGVTPKSTLADRSDGPLRSGHDTTSGAFQTAESEGSGGQDKTHKTDRTEQDTQTERTRPSDAGPPSALDCVEEVIAHYRSYHEHSRPGKKERALIKDRLKEGYSPADICQAIDGCHLSPHHCGQNDRSTKYQTLELIVRDSTHVDQFIQIARNPPGPVRSMTQRNNDQVGKAFLSRIGLTVNGEEISNAPQ